MFEGTGVNKECSKDKLKEILLRHAKCGDNLSIEELMNKNKDMGIILKFMKEITNESLEECRSRIKHLYSVKQYKECKEELLMYHNFLIKNNLRDDYFVNKSYAVTFLKENNYKKCIDCAKIALDYAKTNKEFADLYFCMSSAYKRIDQTKIKYIKYMDLAYDCYISMGDVMTALDLMNNKALFTNNVELAKINVHEYKNLLNQNKCTIEDLDFSLSTLCEIYISINDITNAKDTLANIVSTSEIDRLTNEINKLNEQLAVIL